MNAFQEFFYFHPKRHMIDKWHHYFKIYEKHFHKFLNKNPIILEIGVCHGGSLDMWNFYFHHQCQIYGIDNNPNVKNILQPTFPPNITLITGDQGNAQFWDDFLIDKEFDIIIDDGSHLSPHQILTFEKVYPHLKNGGVYLCEDVHTSYWKDYQGGYHHSDSFIEYSKQCIDLLNAYHIREQTDISLDFRRNTFCISFYDSVVVIDKEIDDIKPSSTRMWPPNLTP
jgi:hypothetical protein